MSNKRISDHCTEAEFNAAREAGLLVASVADECAIHAFADLMRKQAYADGFSAGVASTQVKERVRHMAERLDCFIEEDFRALTLTTPQTLIEWRKRGKVAYVLIGNRYLYPRQAVQEFVASNLRERTIVPTNAVL